MIRSQMGTERHRELSNYRAGIEGIPSILRRVFWINHIPVRGHALLKIRVNAKLMALNFKMFWKQDVCLFSPHLQRLVYATNEL